VLLGVAFPANIGGIGTLVGSPPNAIEFGSGHVPQRQMIRCGAWVSVTILPLLFLVAWVFA